MPRLRMARKPITTPTSAAASTPTPTASHQGQPPCTMAMPVP
jgi:hypothetical protein